MVSTSLPSNHFVGHLRPTTLAAIAADLESSDRNSDDDRVLDQVMAALIANAGEVEAKSLIARAAKLTVG